METLDGIRHLDLSNLNLHHADKLLLFVDYSSSKRGRRRKRRTEAESSPGVFHPSFWIPHYPTNILLITFTTSLAFYQRLHPFHYNNSGGDEDCGTISGCASGGDDIGGRGSVGGGRTPPPRMRAGKMMAVKVKMLDDSITLFQVQVKAQGKILFDQVCKQLNLLEVDYFGLEYQDQLGVTYWVDVEKQMNHQIALTSSEPLFLFCVKFYTPDPAQIEEEYTRYLFSLQIKRDLATGLLQCNDNTAALMASYIVQAECGDYVIEDYPDHTYLSSFKFVPQQDADLERRIMENHKKHVGQSPAEADLNLLETARRCELYGTKMHAAKDHDGMPLNLAVAHMDTGCYRDTVEFYFEDRNQCKKLLEEEYEPKNEKNVVSFLEDLPFDTRVKTQKEMQEFVRENFVKRQSFHRHVRNLHSSMGNVSQSFSAQPLLPLGEALAASEDNLHFNTGPRLLPPQRGRGGSLVPPPVLVSHVSELRLDPLNFDFKEEENDDEDEDLLRRGIVGSGIVHPDYGASAAVATQPVYSVVDNLYNNERGGKDPAAVLSSSSGDLRPGETSLQQSSTLQQTPQTSLYRLNVDDDDDIDEEDEASDDEAEEEKEEGKKRFVSRNRLPTSVASLPNTLLRKDKNHFEKEFYRQVHRTLPHHYRSDKKERSSPEGIVIYDDFGEGEVYPPPPNPLSVIENNEDIQKYRVQYFSLPRNNYDTYFVQQPINPTFNRYFVNENAYHSRTLPRSRNAPPESSTTMSSGITLPKSLNEISNNLLSQSVKSNINSTSKENNVNSTSNIGIQECSSGSSSSHASPRVTRPQTLDFASAKNESAFLRNNIDEDSSSAVSGIYVPQTPESANPFRRDYIDELEEERIYDVPEGIEGVDKPIVAHRRQSKPSRVVSFAPLNKYHKIQHPVPPPRNDVHGAPYPKLRTQLSVVKPGLRPEISTEKPPPIIATPTNRNLLPMSSTESESISARSAPTPLTTGSKNRLLPSPPEESESSLTVLDSESVPAPPEFASIDSRDNHSKPAAGLEDTDVDDEEGLIFSMKTGVASVLVEEPPPIIHQDNAILEGIMEEDEIYEVAIDGDIELEIVDATSSEMLLKEVIRVQVNKDEEIPSQTLSAPPIFVTEKKVEHSEDEVVSDGDRTPEMLKESKEEEDERTRGKESENSFNMTTTALVFPLKEHPQTVFIESEIMDLPSPPLAPSATIIIASSHPPPPQLSFDDDEITTEAVTTVMERSTPTSSEIDLSVIPPPPDEPTQLIHNGYGSFERKKDGDLTPKIEEDENNYHNTLSDQNYSMSDDANKSLSSDIPPAIMKDDSPGFPSPPSSLEIHLPPPTHSSYSKEARKKKEGVQEENDPQIEADSFFLEITPPDFDRSILSDDEGEEMDKIIPYDISLSSNELKQGNVDVEEDNSLSLREEIEEDSLHHSMEILEDVTTEDHFEELRHEDEEEENITPSPPPPPSPPVPLQRGGRRNS
ncbi:FARP2 [Lepeophtheirus salmonis]|uniref:Moesin/ezrin/radixin homolog 1 n=1 Tax=Lepeophtheirus salmonis TaxID=72036 RepID=A0A7R8CSA8_LEPSM|nr:FARP2 [Lepeophtheirus salmonis]CAF2915186.1 FARP2 [Lepeophtheirus salmonis]